MSEQPAVPLKTKEFREKLKDIIAGLDQLLDASKAVSLARAQKPPLVLVDAEGQKLGLREVKSLRSQLAKRINDLAKDYALALKPKRKTGKKKTGTGFNSPMFVTDNLKDFFIDANNAGAIGRVEPSDPSSPPLGNYLYLLTNADNYLNTIAAQIGQPTIPAITSAGLLTALFAIYALINNLTDNATRNMGKEDVQKDHQYLGADERMRKYFGNTFRLLTAKGSHVTPNERKKAAEQGRNPVAIPPFNPNDFRYAAFQSIVANNRLTVTGMVKRRDPETGEVTEVPNPAGGPLNANEAGLLVNPDIIAELTREQGIVSKARAEYHAGQEENRKQLRKNKKAAQKAAGGKTSGSRR